MYVILVILALVISVFVFRYFNGTCKAYKDNMQDGYERIKNQQARIITENDLDGLPVLVKNYLNYVGVVGKEMPISFEMEVEGEMRFDKTKGWAPVTAKQVSFFDRETRLFYIVMKMFGVPINGFHHYEFGKASMVIKILDVFKIIDNRGDEMDKAETVTFFNDMCLFAPATLIDADIKWEEIDDKCVNAVYTNNGITISTKLIFNDQYQLVNFVSDDRFAVDADGVAKQVTWSTPIYEYVEYNGVNLTKKGEAIWHYDDGEFSYIKLDIKEITYN